MNQAVDFGLLLAGGVLLYSAVTGKSIASVVSGTAAPAAASSPTGSVAGAGKSIGSAVSNVTGGGSTIVGDVTSGMLQSIGAAHGWTGSQLTDWANIINAESNGTVSDTNPSSGAYGIAQMYSGVSGEYVSPATNAQKYYTYGGNPGTVTGQLTAMANYIASRYGNPANAWAFHLANGAY